jgi:hypothetical protein
METPVIASKTGSIENQIVEVGSDLARTFNGVLNAIPGGPHRPQWLARSLGVNTVLTSRILKAAQQQDPLAVAHMIPGPEPLRRLLRSAAKKKVDPDLIRGAHDAVDRFERLIHQEAGDRSALDAIISGWLPNAREKVELIAKQSVFRGISQLLGTACDTAHHTAILYPSSYVNDRADSLWLVATRGMRRVRPGLTLKDDFHSAPPMLTVMGRPVEGREGLLLEAFCSKPLPQLHVTYRPGKVQYTLGGDDVGVRSAVDLTYAVLLPGKKELHRSANEPPRKITTSVGVGVPSRMFTFDVLLHEDIYPGQHPTLHLYQTLADGVADPNDRSRDADRLDVIESLQLLGQGVNRFRSTETPAYLEMLGYICQQRGWDGRKLRGYRCRIEYPIYSSQIMMSFDLPSKPQ